MLLVAQSLQFVEAAGDRLNLFDRTVFYQLELVTVGHEVASYRVLLYGLRISFFLVEEGVSEGRGALFRLSPRKLYCILHKVPLILPRHLPLGPQMLQSTHLLRNCTLL